MTLQRHSHVHATDCCFLPGTAHRKAHPAVTPRDTAWTTPTPGIESNEGHRPSWFRAAFLAAGHGLSAISFLAMLDLVIVSAAWRPFHRRIFGCTLRNAAAGPLQRSIADGVFASSGPRFLDEGCRSICPTVGIREYTVDFIRYRRVVRCPKVRDHRVSVEDIDATRL